MLSILLGAHAQLHDPGSGHPESAARTEQLTKSLDRCGYPLEHCARKASREDLLAVHASAYVDYVLGLDGAEANLDHETHLGRGSVQAALNAAGTALELAERLLVSRNEQIFAVVRPPGHHAEAAKTSGYCVFNNVALAAERLRREGLRVCILDWDVHHGNGTESIFSADSDVLFVSVHSDRLFPPDTGAVTAIGQGAGLGATVNIALPAGSSLAAYAFASTCVVLPVVRRFRPDVILVSLGFDARQGDPQGDMRLQTDDFRFIGATSAAAARGTARGRVGLVLEGGYDVASIGDCALATLTGLGQDLDDWDPGPPSSAARECVLTAARVHGIGPLG